MAENGRPTKWSKALEAKAYEYVNSGWEEAGHAVPMVVGLCDYIDRARSTIYEWAKDENKSFSDILERIKEKQELVVFTQSLKGKYNSTMAKLMLTKHGYSDKHQEEQEEQELTPIPIGVKDAS